MTVRKRGLATLALGLAFGLATPLEGVCGQIDSPKRDVGGSCVYDREGRVVGNPVGVRCPDRTEGAGAAQGGDPVPKGLPEPLQRDASALSHDFARIDDELAQLAQVIRSGDQKLALETLRRLTSDMVDHRRREESFVQQVARENSR